MTHAQALERARAAVPSRIAAQLTAYDRDLLVTHIADAILRTHHDAGREGR